jgi:uncharacterized membrane protein YsdA (DUF1294 family)
MTADSLFYSYLIIINLISGIVFAYDKFAAVTKRTRIMETVLHLFEAFGGAFTNLLLMYVLRHKTKKSMYYMWTWIFMTLWLFVVLLVVLL